MRSVRASGETKTRRSRRTLELPARAADALWLHRKRQRHVRLVAGDRWQGAGDSLEAAMRIIGADPFSREELVQTCVVKHWVLELIFAELPLGPTFLVRL